ncbi:MAG: hypothetical protein ACYC7E_16755 [Armatimonadota bacterium]
MASRRFLMLLIPLLVLLTGVLAVDPPWYRTSVPKITPERWTTPAPAAPEFGTLTKKDYLDYITAKWTTVRTSAVQAMGKPDAPQQWKHARTEAFWYQVTKDERYARSAMGFIRGDYRYRTEGAGKEFAKAPCACPEIIPSLMAYHWIKKCPSLTKADHELARKWVELKIDNYQYYETGAMNRGMGGSACVMICNYWFPDAAGKPLTPIQRLPWLKDLPLTREGYVKMVQPQWYDFRDTYEDSTGYVSHSLEMVFAAWEMTEQTQLFQDPGMKKLAERYLTQMVPHGAMPGYGDVMGYNASPYSWITLFERWATAYKDGRFKWAAQRMFEFYRRHEADYAQWGNPIYDAMDSLMEAYLVADDTIKPVKPDIPSIVTHRKDLRWLDFQKAGRHADQLEREIPDKLVLRTGWGPSDAYALVELCKPMSHGHSNTASLESYVADDSVLLAAPTYLIRSPLFHNSLIAWPKDRPGGNKWFGEVLHAGRCEVQVKAFHQTPEAAFAHIQVTDYMNGPTTLDRRVFFLGKRGIWLRDTLSAIKPFTGTIGPAFQFVGVYPDKGANWVNACQTSVPIPFLWKTEYMMQLTNRPVDLLVYYVPKAGARLAVDDVTSDTTKIQYQNPPFNNFTDRVWYQKEVAWTGGQRETFDTYLLPHRPVANGAQLAGMIRSVLQNGDDCAVMRLDLSADKALYVGINAEGQSLQAGAIRTDARYFTAVVGTDRTVDYWVVDATTLTVNGKKVLSVKERATRDSRTETGAAGK